MRKRDVTDVTISRPHLASPCRRVSRACRCVEEEEDEEEDEEEKEKEEEEEEEEEAEQRRAKRDERVAMQKNREWCATKKRA